LTRFIDFSLLLWQRSINIASAQGCESDADHRVAPPMAIFPRYIGLTGHLLEI
jgi:hypothetical protein